MKIKKIESVLLTIGFGALLLGAVLFFVIPLIAGSGFEYSGVEAFVAGVKSVFKFDFNDSGYALIASVSVVLVICIIVWAIIVGTSKHKRHFIPMVFSAIGIIALDFLIATYFIANVRFNGTEGILFKMIKDNKEVLIGKLLSMIVLVLLYISLMFFTLYAFIDLVTLVIDDKLNERYEPVKQPEFDPLEGLDDRKAREEALFKACIETGEFTQYDELELDKPLEGYTEEPVFETTEIEEEAAIITRKDFVKVASKTTISEK